MLPIVDKPTIQYIIEEAIASGIEQILIITGRGKRAIEDHFDRSFELEEELRRKGDDAMLAQVQEIANLVDIHYIRQKEPRGLGQAIYCARAFIGDEPFAVLLGDDIVDSKKPCLRQLMDVFDIYHTTVLGVQRVPWEEVSRYGIVAGKEMDKGIIRIEDMVEKPDQEDAPSNVAILGRYIIRPSIFGYLENAQPGKNGEIQLTDALRRQMGAEAAYAYEFEGRRYDVGNKQGFLQATVDFALKRPELRDEFETWLRNRIC
jgi:UTP--glucose-1-phosphate uridylyltransferase